MRLHSTTGWCIPPFVIAPDRLRDAIADYVRAGRDREEGARRRAALAAAAARPERTAAVLAAGEIELGFPERVVVSAKGRVAYSLPDLTAVIAKLHAEDLLHQLKCRGGGLPNGLADVSRWTVADVFAEIDGRVTDGRTHFLVTADVRKAHDSFDVTPTLDRFLKRTRARAVAGRIEAFYAAVFARLSRSYGLTTGLVPGVALAPAMFRVARRDLEDEIASIASWALIYEDNLLVEAASYEDASEIVAALDRIAAQHRARFGSRAEFHSALIHEFRAGVGFVEPFSFLGIEEIGFERRVSIEKIAEFIADCPVVLGRARSEFFRHRIESYAALIGRSGVRELEFLALGMIPERLIEEGGRGEIVHLSLQESNAESRSRSIDLRVDPGTADAVAGTPDGNGRAGGGGNGTSAVPAPPRPRRRRQPECLQPGPGGLACPGDEGLAQRYRSPEALSAALLWLEHEYWLGRQVEHLGPGERAHPFNEAPRGHCDALTHLEAEGRPAFGCCEVHARRLLRSGVYLDHFRFNAPSGNRDSWNVLDVLHVGRLVADAAWIAGLTTMLLHARQRGWIRHAELRAAIAGARRLPSALRWDPRRRDLSGRWPEDADGDALLRVLAEHEGLAPSHGWPEDERGLRSMLRADLSTVRLRASTRRELFGLHVRLRRLMEDATTEQDLALEVVRSLRSVVHLGDPARRARRHDTED